jgi:protein-disulfide isomerase
MRSLAASVALLVALAAPAAAQTSGPAPTRSFDPDTIYAVPTGTSPSEGLADAPVTIVVWSDYACKHCNLVQGTLDQLWRLYPGKLRLVHRTLPLDPEDTLAAEASLAAAAQGAFRPMHDRLYAVHGKVDRDAVELIARSLGLDLARLRADLDTHAYAAAIATDIADASALGVAGTPTFFIDGKPVFGDEPLRVFTAVVDDALDRAARVADTHPADLYRAIVGDGRPTADAPGNTANPRPRLDMQKVYRVGLGLPGHQIGAADAPVTIVEWSDFACKFCRQEWPVLQHVRRKYGDVIRIAYRHLPLHRESNLAAEAAVAAAQQGKFWAFHDELFTQFGHLTRTDLEAAAAKVGLDVAAFRAALDDRRYRDVVEADAADGSALGCDGTPTLFVDGHPINGAVDEATLDTIIDAQLGLARSAMDKGIAAADLYALEMSGALGAERADPDAVPAAPSVHIEPSADDRERDVLAACRSRDAVRARRQIANLHGDRRNRVAAVCVARGIDL